MTLELIITAAALGAGLAMDAFSVSLANGLAEPQMNTERTIGIAGTYGGFQFAMPLIGWYLVTKAAERFEAFRPLIPWIALILLLLIGGGMLKDGIKGKSAGGETGEQKMAALGAGALMMQGVATSIDALSVGFTISEYDLSQAAASAFIIGAVTFAICFAGLHIGRRLGTVLAGKASVLGGVILIVIGLEIWIRGVFF